MAASIASAISYSSLSLSTSAACSQSSKRISNSHYASRVTRFDDAPRTGLDMETKGIRQLQTSKSCADDRRARSRKGGIVTLAVHTNEGGISSTGERDSLPSPGSARSPGTDCNTKGWTDEHGNQNARLIAQVRNVALAARDRAEMHATIGLQRDNWNKLCHTTVVTTTVVAALLAAINSASTLASPSVALTAFLLNAGTAGLMFLAGTMQPSQLAEEQRSAARQCKNMADEIDATLLIDPRLREDAHLYIDDKLTRLRAVDMAYPLPLLPNGLPKFPEVVKPSVVNAPVDPSEPKMPANNSNGWSAAIAEDLERTAEKLKSADVEIYLGWARKKERQNLRLAIAAPVLVAAAAFFNVLECFAIGNHVWMSGMAAACSVLAMFCFSFAQGGQIGMIFEMYRNCAGSFADVDNTIQRAIRIPVCQREDGELLHLKIALQLGRRDQVPMVRPGDKTAGKVF